MGTTPWSVSLEGAIEFHDRVTPAGYHRPDYWHPCFHPRVWREEAPCYWQRFLVGLQLSIAAHNQVSFNWYYAKAMQELEDEFFYHLEDYCTKDQHRALLELQGCFQLPPSLDPTPQPMFGETDLNALMRLSIDRDIESCHALCGRWIEAGQQPEIFDCIQAFAIAGREKDFEILSAVLFALLGEAECERLFNESAVRRH
jgi:hypothetical protein